MTTSRTYIAACAYALPLLVGMAALGGSGDLVLRTAIAGAVAVVHLVASDVACRRFLGAVARRDDPSALPRFVLRQATAVPLALLLLALLGPHAVALGFGCLVAGAALQAAVQLIRAADASTVAALEPT